MNEQSVDDRPWRAVTKTDETQGRSQELFELVSSFLGSVALPRLKTACALTPGGAGAKVCLFFYPWI